MTGSTLYGVAYSGGAFAADCGTVFALNTDGSGFSNGVLYVTGAALSGACFYRLSGQ